MFVQHVKRFLRSETGVVSVEAIFWIPFFMALAVLVVDASFLFMREAQALRILHEGNRNRSVYGFETTTEVEEWVTEQLQDFIANPEVLVEEDTTDNIITTVAVLNASEMIMSGWFASILDIKITLVASHQIEY